KMLEDIDELRSDMGRITIGVLIAQDIAIVPILLIAESLGSQGPFDYLVLVKMALAIGGLAALIWALGRPGKVVLPFSDRIADKPDLLTLAMLAFCMASAVLSSLLGLSAVYGAFVAGLVVGKSTLRTEAIPATHPVQSLLIVVFFLSIGLLIDLDFIADNWVMLVLFVLTIIAMKSVFNVAILRIAGERWENAFPAGLIMSQIGEFSFVIAAVGLQAAVIDYSIYQAAITLIAVSLLVSPFWLVTVRRFHEVAEKGVRSFRAALAEVYEDELAEIERGARLISVTSRATTRWGRASYRAVKDAASRKPRHQADATKAPQAEASMAASTSTASPQPDAEDEITLTDGLGRMAKQVRGGLQKGAGQAAALAGSVFRRGATKTSAGQEQTAPKAETVGREAVSGKGVQADATESKTEEVQSTPSAPADEELRRD
ncbi:MAG: cation:proton antiporter, partial [Pseudomonadota bacterium]|nr:cation:proton antiporter [Pseudomonadota bacterium]